MPALASASSPPSYSRDLRAPTPAAGRDLAKATDTASKIDPCDDILFSADDIVRLRTEHRIVCAPVGTLLPRSTQNRILSTPARLGALARSLIRNRQVELSSSQDNALPPPPPSYTPPPDTPAVRILRAVWQRGLFLSSGSKFGCDALVYKGDPHYNHSSYLLTILDAPEIDRAHLLAVNRVAVATRKKALVAWVCPVADAPVLLVFDWCGQRRRREREAAAAEMQRSANASAEL